MTFREVLAQIVDWLQQDGRVSYLALKRQFNLGDDDLEDLKEALAFSHPQVHDEKGNGLVWTEAPPTPLLYPQPEAEKEARFHALIPDVIARLQRDRRMTYRTLKYTLGIDDLVLTEIREELRLASRLETPPAVG